MLVLLEVELANAFLLSLLLFDSIMKNLLRKKKGLLSLKISKEHAEHYNWGNQCDGWHLVKNNELSVIHERMPANTTEVSHYHQQAILFCA